MARDELKLKQASAVLGVPTKDLQNFVQAGVVKPRRRGAFYYFDRKTLLRAKVAFYLKDSLGTSTRYLTAFSKAVSHVPGFASGEPAVVCLRSTVRKNEQPMRIYIPLGGLVEELDERLPLASAARDLPRGRKRPGWKKEFLAAIQEAASDLEGVSAEQVADVVKTYRRERVKPEPTVVAEAVETTA